MLCFVPYFAISMNNKLLRGIWVMVDVVANHVGPVGYNYTTISPFNSASHYHGCSDCPSGCQIQDFTNEPQVSLHHFRNYKLMMS